MKKISAELGALPIIKDPVSFTSEFDPSGKPSIDFQINSKGFSGRVIHSPYYPYKELKTVSIEAYKCPHRYLNIDKFWNVFWVEIVECGENTKFFGPYFSENYPLLL